MPSVMLRRMIAIALLFGGAIWPGDAHASNYGYSLNINFAAREPIEGPAGLFNDRGWNTTRVADSQGPRLIFQDVFGDPGQSRAVLSWQSVALGDSQNVQSRNVNDVRLMESYLSSPTQIRLDNLDLIVPRQEGVTYSVLIYTHAGTGGEEGAFIVNNLRQEHVDPAQFVGDFRVGKDGNVVVFEDLTESTLLIQTEGFAPINAMSVMYCRNGDFNGDGTVDVADLDDLNHAAKENSSDSRFDVNFDLVVNWDDVLAWIKWSKGTCIGDVNLDGVFDSSDLIDLFQAGLYESGSKEATWTTGDWNGDCKFDSSDLLLAFQEGCYESGPLTRSIFPWTTEMPATGDAVDATVPEPATGGAGLLLASCWLARHVRRQLRRRGN